MPDFLLEIGCEEIPARMIEAGAKEFGNNIALALHQSGLSATTTGKYVWTPRRLTVHLPNLPVQEPDVERDELGPSLKVAFKDGAPTAAAEAFAKKHSVSAASLKKVTTPKGDYVAVRAVRKGRATREVLKGIVEAELGELGWPKTMYWRAKTTERFVRPIRWIVAVLGETVLPIEFAGVVASRTSHGHRTLSTGEVEIRSSDFQHYVDTLEGSRVIVNPFEREQQIRKALDAATRTISGARWREDKSLLDTVVNLTEFPSVVLGGFDPQFLTLPEEVLVTVMRDHQKYFAIEDAAGKLLPHFLAVLNTEGDPQGLIRHGNERVLRARFNDARFFWETDQKKTLLDRLELLRHVTFQKDLGSYYEKTQRVQRLCSWLNEQLKRAGITVRPGVTHKAACLAKTDLTTELVKEFTELQGIVGGLYARAQQLDATLPEATRMAIAEAVYDQYKPESTDDEIPRSLEGAVLSIADKADSIAGMFALGLVPSGSKDPFALRRQANGIVKIIAEKKLPLALSELMDDVRLGYRKSEAEKKFIDDMKFTELVRGFFRERLEFYLKDVRGYEYDVVKAVLAANADDVVDALARAEAVKQVLHMPEFPAIGAACKRIRNILRQAAEKGIRPAVKFETLPDAATEEKDLAAFLEKHGAEIGKFCELKNYRAALLVLATARDPVDRFFEKVMVMVDDERVRANRLALLETLLREFSTIADFSEIVTEGKAS
jgi:glycyl-tRNA synthetase beta chain